MQELWDLYDENRNPLHITHVRGARMKRGTYHVAVGIWTVNDRQEILVTLRSHEKPDWPEYVGKHGRLGSCRRDVKAGSGQRIV